MTRRSEVEVTLPWGITLDRVERVATRVVQLTRGWFGADRRDVARVAVLEAVYAATEPPTSRDLVAAGRKAVWQHHSAELKTNGLTARHDGVHDAAAAYWYGDRLRTRSFESGLVERVALQQIFVQLSHRQQQALVALAAFGTHQAAAAALGLSTTAFTNRIIRGRRRFLALWHEHERPSPVWGVGHGQQHDAAVRRLWLRKWNRTQYLKRKAAG